jgi:hypothetical protein
MLQPSEYLTSSKPVYWHMENIGREPRTAVLVPLPHESVIRVLELQELHSCLQYLKNSVIALTEMSRCSLLDVC